MTDAKHLTQSLLDATARQDYASAEVSARREALTDELRRLWEQGIKATVPIDGLGKAEWRVYEPTARVVDEQALMDWATQLTTSRIVIPANEHDEAMRVLREAGVSFHEERSIRQGDRDGLLARLTPTDDGHAVTADGEIVPGVVFEAQAPNLYVTVDSGRKAESKRAARQAVIEELTRDA